MATESDTAAGERDEDLLVESRGDSLGAARRAAMKELEPRFPGITIECVSFDIVEEGGDGEEAVVRGVVDEDAWREVASEELPDEPAERLRAMVTRVVQALGLDATVEITETDEELRATVNGDEELGLLIGKHGATIDALQHLAMRVALRGDVERKQVTVDAAGYRDRRENALQRSADRAVAEALRYGRPVELEPMRSLERKVVHMYLRDRTDIETHSEGDEPDRRLVVSPVRTSDTP
jgi:spoIIIJ-associated protein